MNIAKGVEKIQENQERGVELLSIFSKQPASSVHAASSNPTPSSSVKSNSNYCLWCWTITGIFCGFLAAVFIEAVGLSLIISSKEPIMKPQCIKIEHNLSNSDSVSPSWGHISVSASIFHQEDSGTTLVMPCEGVALDEICNEYQIDGAYKLNCNPPVTFNYVTRVVTWKADPL
jgi:hypothetical protein